MKTVVILLSLVFLLGAAILSSSVAVSLEYGEGRPTLAVSALGGLFRRRLGRSRTAETARRASGYGRRLLAAGWRLREAGLYLLKRTRLEKLDVTVVIGLERPDLTAWTVGGAWALAGPTAAALGRLMAPGSARPSWRVTPCFGKQHFALAVQAKVRVMVWHLLAALWLARHRRGGTRKTHKFRPPGPY